MARLEGVEALVLAREERRANHRENLKKKLADESQRGARKSYREGMAVHACEENEQHCAEEKPRGCQYGKPSWSGMVPSRFHKGLGSRMLIGLKCSQRVESRHRGGKSHLGGKRTLGVRMRAVARFPQATAEAFALPRLLEAAQQLTPAVEYLPVEGRRFALT